jgi:hypothetical protein
MEWYWIVLISYFIIGLLICLFEEIKYSHKNEWYINILGWLIFSTTYPYWEIKAFIRRRKRRKQ